MTAHWTVTDEDVRESLSVWLHTYECDNRSKEDAMHAALQSFLARKLAWLEMEMETAPARIIALVPWFEGAEIHSGFWNGEMFQPDFRGSESVKPTGYLPLPPTGETT
jgi:hypothetical protein